jgi:hypothetical protein
MNKIKYFFKQFVFLKALNSPFKPFKLKWYIGKISIGTPYFFPRKWVDLNEKEVEAKAKERYDKLNEELKTKVTLDHYKQHYKNTQKAIPKLIGFDFVELGWKTKWSSTDYRFEHSPLISFVFFKWQIALMFIAPEPNHYWTSWLYYEYNTNKSFSKRERIKQCQKEFPQNWTQYKNGNKETINYYKFILKEKYL